MTKHHVSDLRSRLPNTFDQDANESFQSYECVEWEKKPSDEYAFKVGFLHGALWFQDLRNMNNEAIWTYGSRPLISPSVINRIVVKKPKQTLWQRVVRRAFQGPWKRFV